MRSILVTWMLLALAPAAVAQIRSLTGLQPDLPIVPPASHRDLRSGAQDFNADPRDPVAGLVDSVTESDAIVEVVLNSGRILTTKTPIANDGGLALVAVGEPTVLDFDVVGPRMLRVLGKRVGVSDLTITTDDGNTYSFDVHVVYDLDLVRAYMQQLFPEATIELSQLREHVILGGQARSTAQVTQIVQTLQSFLASSQPETSVEGGTTPQFPGSPREAPPVGYPEQPEEDEPSYGPAPIDLPEDRPKTEATYPRAQIINLMKIPGVQQVMLKVQVAELNRSALRRIGADLSLGAISGNAVETFLGNDFLATAITVFDNGDSTIFFNALRNNSVMNVLAEPTLVAMHGQEAAFLAGGEFPFTVPQVSGGTTFFTVQFKPFGVQLNFVPYILDDETIRLRVAPEVSSINEALTVSLGGGIQVPGLDTRAVNTTVEMTQGQTLAIGGLLQVELEANTQRIPGLGDLPYIGIMFSNTSHERVEKELIVLVTPFLVSPMDCDQHVCLPGEEILDPNDCEFYLHNRLEGRTGRPFRSTTAWDDPIGFRRCMQLESRHACGPVGFTK